MTQVEQPTSIRERLEVEVRRVTREDVPQLTATLARAFDDDPFSNWFVAQDKRRARRIYDFMNVSLTKLALPHGECFTTADLQGGALWTPPGKWKLGMLQQLLLVPSMVKSTGWKRIPRRCEAQRWMWRRRWCICRSWFCCREPRPDCAMGWASG